MQIKIAKENQELLAALAKSQGLNVNQLGNRLLDRALRPELNAVPLTPTAKATTPAPLPEISMEF